MLVFYRSSLPLTVGYSGACMALGRGSWKASLLRKTSFATEMHDARRRGGMTNPTEHVGFVTFVT
jgi:hypothetical protein